MRRYFVLGFVVVALLAMTSVALAGGYASGTGNPHGGYSDSGTKCKVCHAVHNAATGSGQQALLRSSRAGACVYCHLTNDYGTYRPYGTTGTNYSAESPFNHAQSHSTYTAYNGCVSCHTVHGAGSIGSAGIGGSDESTGGADFILKANPGLALGGNVQNQIDFCRDCHNKVGGNVAGGGCFDGTCHTAGETAEVSSEYFLNSRDGVTHVMTTVLTGPSPALVEAAWVTSEKCKSCHSGGLHAPSYQQGDSFPHWTGSNAQFLRSYPTENSNLDAVCLDCHINTGDPSTATKGVGKTY